MTAFEYILDGLEAALALERELGLRSVAIDRSLLLPPAPPNPAPVDESSQATNLTPEKSPELPRPQSSNPTPSPIPQPQSPPIAQPHPQKAPNSQATQSYDFVFLHDRTLTGAGAEMIAKITAALGRTPETAPVIVEPPRPTAKIYVVLGDRALKMWFPGLRASPGMWIKGQSGEDALVTHSPNYILRFGEVTPAVRQIKSAMWKSLQAISQRLALARTTS